MQLRVVLHIGLSRVSRGVDILSLLHMMLLRGGDLMMAVMLDNVHSLRSPDERRMNVTAETHHSLLHFGDDSECRLLRL